VTVSVAMTDHQGDNPAVGRDGGEWRPRAGEGVNLGPEAAEEDAIDVPEGSLELFRRRGAGPPTVGGGADRCGVRGFRSYGRVQWPRFVLVPRSNPVTPEGGRERCALIGDIEVEG